MLFEGWDLMERNQIVEEPTRMESTGSSLTLMGLRDIWFCIILLSLMVGVRIVDSFLSARDSVLEQLSTMTGAIGRFIVRCGSSCLR